MDFREEHFSKEDAFLKLEMKHLNIIITKISEAVVSAQKKTVIFHSNDSGDETNIHSFINSIFTYLDKALVTPSDTLNATLTLNNSNSTEFADCLKLSIDKMHQILEDQLRSVSDVRYKLTRLSVNKPQEELFSRVFGCGEMCPFCSWWKRPY